MCGHPTYTCLGSGPSKALQIPTSPHVAPPSWISTRRAHKAPPCFKNSAHQPLQRYQRRECDQIRSEPEKSEALLCGAIRVQGGSLKNPSGEECPDPSPPLQGVRALRWNTSLLERANTHWPSPTQLHRNHPG